MQIFTDWTRAFAAQQYDPFARQALKSLYTGVSSRHGRALSYYIWTLRSINCLTTCFAKWSHNRWNSFPIKLLGSTSPGVNWYNYLHLNAVIYTIWKCDLSDPSTSLLPCEDLSVLHIWILLCLRASCLAFARASCYQPLLWPRKLVAL